MNYPVMVMVVRVVVIFLILAPEYKEGNKTSSAGPFF